MGLLPTSVAPASKRNVYSPATFVVAPSSLGVKADYYTDGVADEVQISAAILAASLVGGSVYLKGGPFHVSTNPISILSNFRIYGDGMDKTIIYGDSTLGTNAVMLAGGTSIGSPSTDVEFANFTIDGSSMPTAPVSTFRKGIDAIYTLRWKLDSVRVYHTPATGFGPDCNVDIKMVNCIADTCGTAGQNPGYNGFGIGVGFYENESVQLINCTARNCLNNGFLFEYVGGNYNSKDYQLTNCYAINNTRGYRVSGASGLTFTNCKAIKNTNEGFYVQLFGVNNPNPTNTKFIACDAYENGSDGFYNKDQEYGQFNTIFQGCHSYKNNGYGIISGGSYFRAMGNHTYLNAKTGIFYHANSTKTVYDGQIIGNTSYNNGYGGTPAQQDGIRVWGELGTIDGIIVALNRCFDNQAIATFTDGAISATSQLLTSATAGFDAYDVGKSITINGAGAAGANLTTTILGYRSSTQILIATAASTTVSGATFSTGAAATQQNGITIKSLVIDGKVIDNDVRGNVSAGLLDARTTPSDTSVSFRNNDGFNPDRTYVQGNVTGATTFNRINGKIITATLTGNITATVTSGPAIGDELILVLTQDGTGGRTATWPGNVKLRQGGFTLSTAAAAVDSITLRWDGTNWYEITRGMDSPTSSTQLVVGTSANIFTVGANGTTNPLLNLDASTASIATGINIKGAAAAAGVAITTLSSGSNENLSISSKGTGTLNLNASANGNVSFANGTFVSTTGAVVVKSTSSNSLAVGPNGTTNPALKVDSSTASAATGLSITAAAAAGGLAVAVISSGSNENLTINAKGTGTIGIGSVSTGAITLGQNTTITGNLTLGTAGNKLSITTGTNASAGTGTLSSGTATINTTAVTASSLIFLTDTSNGANLGTLSVGTKTAGTSFVVNSSNALDAATFNWLIIN